jgi:hypothetical protein
VLLPPINGATAATGATDVNGGNGFTANPGDPFHAWDASATFDYMPSQFITWRFELNHREADVPYFVGPGGITPPGANGVPQNTGNPSDRPNGWSPDLVKSETRMTAALLIRL